MYGCAVACQSWPSTIRRVEEIKDFDSKPHELLRFEVRCKKENQEVRSLQKLPTSPPGVSGGTTPSVEDSVAWCWACYEHPKTQRRANLRCESRKKKRKQAGKGPTSH